MEALKCSNCGSSDLTRIDKRELICKYCNTRSLLSADQSMLTIVGRKCPECGFVNDRKARFCGECGSRLVQMCSNCEAHVSGQLRFCPHCGHDLSVKIRMRPQTVLEEAQRTLKEAVEETKRASREADLRRAALSRLRPNRLPCPGWRPAGSWRHDGGPYPRLSPPRTRSRCLSRAMAQRSPRDT